MSGDSINMMHRDMKIQNIFVTNATNLELAELAVGDFGGAQHGHQTVRVRGALGTPKLPQH